MVEKIRNICCGLLFVIMVIAISALDSVSDLPFYVGFVATVAFIVICPKDF